MAKQIVGLRLEREAEQPDGVAFKNFQFAEQFFTTRSRWRRLTSRAVFTMDMSSSYSGAADTSAAVSFPKHESPICKKRMPMRRPNPCHARPARYRVSADSLFLMAVAEHPPPRCSVMILVCASESQRRASGI